MSVRNYYYARISDKSQKEFRQIDAIKGLDIDPRDIYVDKCSGKDFNRPEWNALKRGIRIGDVLFIKSIDRLGRNKTLILEQWKWLTDNGIEIVVLDMPLLDTRKYKELSGVGELITDLVLQILAWLAEEERVNIKQRQKEGIEAARVRGNVKFGRPKIEMGEQFKDLYNKWSAKEITSKNFMNEINVKPNTFYRRISEYELEKLKKAAV